MSIPVLKDIPSDGIATVSPGVAAAWHRSHFIVKDDYRAKAAAQWMEATIFEQ